MGLKVGLKVGIVLAAMGILASSCHLTQRAAPSVLILAIEQLGVNEINCPLESRSNVQTGNQPEVQGRTETQQEVRPNSLISPAGSSRSGISLMCQASVRFTHAFTTSPLAGPALASLLTAQYPIQHGLRNNKSMLTGRSLTVTEAAQQLGVATSFFSGGAPVLRKLNLQQGFETFDDNIAPTGNLLFRPFRKTEKIFETWLKDIGHQPFMSIFYLPDLNFPHTATFNSLGEARELNFESQLEEFDDSLYVLIDAMKKRHLWDSTMVILVGLNGPSITRTTELSPTDLFSERTQVSLLIKPAQKPRDEGLNWGFDQNVSLADIGSTLFSMYNSQPAPSIPQLPVLNLQSVLKNPSSHAEPEANWNRPVLIESAWPEIKTLRSAFRWNQYLFLLDENPTAYNSLIDKLESSPIRISESSLRIEWEQVMQTTQQLKIPLSPKIEHETYLKWKGLGDFWSADPLSHSLSAAQLEEAPFVLERLAHRLKNDDEVAESYSSQLLEQQNWPELRRWAQGMKLADLEALANLNLNSKIAGKPSPIHFHDKCLEAAYLGQLSVSETRPCADLLTLSLFEWIRAERGGSELSRDSSRKKFLRQYSLAKLDHRILESFWSLQGTWDLSPDLRTNIPPVEMILCLPDLQKFRVLALKTLQQQKEETN